MNFLAHFHLAWPDEGLIAGGLEGDYYKGPMRGEFHQSLERGIELHRAIDAFTDNHALIGELREHFPRELRRYAGILVDVSFDHFLTRHWSLYSDVPLRIFTDKVYQALSNQAMELSEDSRAMLERMLKYDMLNRYGDWDSVPATAERVGERFRRGNPLSNIDPQLAPIKTELERSFLRFYPLLLDFSKNWQVSASK